MPPRTAARRQLTAANREGYLPISIQNLGAIGPVAGSLPGASDAFEFTGRY